MTFIIFRHGDRDKNTGDDFELVQYQLGLTETGIAEISSMADKILARFPDVSGANSIIYSSPMPRAVQSGEIVRSKLDLPRMYLSKAFEETYIARDYSKGIEENRKIEKYHYENPDDVNEALGLSYNGLVARIKDQLREIAKSGLAYGLVSAHGGVVRKLSYDLDPSLAPKKFPKKWFGDVPTASYTLVDYDPEVDKFVLQDFAVK